MKLSHLFCITALLLVSCNREPNKPTLLNAKEWYTYEQNEYSRVGDSIVKHKRNIRYFQVEIRKDKDPYEANWTEYVDTSRIDTSLSDLDKLAQKQQFATVLNARFCLDSNGNIDSLINWYEIKKFADSLTSSFYAMEGYSKEQIIFLEPLIDIYQTKTQLTQNLFKGIIIYHNFYSFDLTFNDTLLENQMSTYNGVGLIPTKVKITDGPLCYIDYVVSSEFQTNVKPELLETLETNYGVNVPEQFSRKVIDSVFYRYNRDLNAIEQMLYLRTISMDSIQKIEAIQLTRTMNLL